MDSWAGWGGAVVGWMHDGGAMAGWIHEAGWGGMDA